MISIPSANEYNPFYETYVSKIDKDDVLEFLRLQSQELPALMRSLPEGKSDHRYAAGKWSIAELLNHITDTERVFSYRAFAISRGEKQELPGMDQDDYANAANTGSRSFESLINEFEAVRLATLALLESFDEVQLSQVGKASGFPVTTKGLAGIIAGHAAHHIQILKDRYL